MKKRSVFFVTLILFTSIGFCQPNGFVDIKTIIPDIQLDIRYYSSNNFIGSRINGYLAPKAFLSIEAANALAKVAAELRQKGMMLKIFDAYRSQTAVNHFKQWSREASDTLMKSQYYPNVPKMQLFGKGYIASKSGHSRGSTIDLTIVNIKTKKELEMGGSFDFLDPISSHNTTLITPAQAANRRLLKVVMEKYGFKSYLKEWWHYTLINEPYPKTYFDFPVK